MRTNRIAFLLTVIAIAAVGFAAFRSAGGPWTLLADSVPQFLLMMAPSVGVTKARLTKSWRSPYFVFSLVGFLFLFLPWPINDYSSRSNWLEERIDGLFHAIDQEELPPPTPPKLIEDRKPRSAMSFQEFKEDLTANLKHSLAMNEWSFARDLRAKSARRIAHGWLALALGGLAAFAASFFVSPSSARSSDQDTANRRSNGGVPAEVPVTADPGSASLADVES